jgi:hypothetical protein
VESDAGFRGLLVTGALWTPELNIHFSGLILGLMANVVVVVNVTDVFNTNGVYKIHQINANGWQRTDFGNHAPLAE